MERERRDCRSCRRNGTTCCDNPAVAADAAPPPFAFGLAGPLAVIVWRPIPHKKQPRRKRMFPRSCIFSTAKKGAAASGWSRVGAALRWTRSVPQRPCLRQGAASGGGSILQSSINAVNFSSSDDSTKISAGSRSAARDAPPGRGVSRDGRKAKKYRTTAALRPCSTFRVYLALPQGAFILRNPTVPVKISAPGIDRKFRQISP